MNTDRSFKLNPFLKLLPIILYYIAWIPEIFSKSGRITVADAFYIMFLATIFLLIRGWGLVFIEIYMFVSPQGTAKTVMGIISLILCIISSMWMLFLEFIVYVSDRYWSISFLLGMCLYMLLAGLSALILAGKVRTK